MGRLFWKIFFAFWLALIATALATALAVSRHRGARVAPDVELAAAALQDGGVQALRGWLGERRGPPLFVVDESGRDVLGRPVPRRALEGARRLAASGNDGTARIAEAPSGQRYLLFVPDFRRLMHRRGGAVAGPWLLVAIGAAASLAVSALLAWYLARPIRSLRWAFRAAAQGRLETRVQPLMKGRRDEIADLGGDFDRMAEQLQGLVGAQRRLLHDVSHELRSPLARLEAAIGLLRQDPRRLEVSLERIEREVARLDALVGEVLTLARLEGGTSGGPVETLDLADLVASIAADARFEAQAAGREVELKSEERVPVRGRAELLHRAVENVVRNAVKHTAEGSTVRIELSMGAAPPRARLVVADRGPGIPPEELDRVFEPFYRSGRTESSGGGFGLGLAIAKRAVAAHDGTIRARNAPAGGLQVEIELPLAREDPDLKYKER